MANVRVIGAGIVGLSCALALRENRHTVCVVAAEFGNRTVSSVAGALWLPFLCAPKARTDAWARETYLWLEALAREVPEAGVDLLECVESASSNARQSWHDALPTHVVTEFLPRSPLAPTLAAWRFCAPRADPHVFLPWFRQHLEALGIEFEHRRIRSLAEEAVQVDAIVNCTGLEARALVEDEALQGLRGDLCLVEPGAWGLSCAAANEETASVYVIPRRGSLVIGGSSIPTSDTGVIQGDPDRAQELLRAAREAGVDAGAYIGAIAGVRPYRNPVRLEFDSSIKNLVHCYGHGGSGWTLSRGCALEVAQLVGGVGGV